MATIYIFGPKTDGSALSMGWNGYTFRWIIPSTLLLYSATMVRVGFEYYNIAWAFAKCYMGHVAASGDAYDFAVAPTQLLFSGGAGGAVNAGGLISDDVSFNLDKTKNLMFAFYFSDAAKDDVPYNNAILTYGAYYKAGDDCTTVDASGYSTSGVDKMRTGVSSIFYRGPACYLHARRNRMSIKGVSTQNILA